MALESFIYQNFRAAFEDNCYELICEAHHIALKDNLIFSDHHENDITQILYENLDKSSKRLQFNIAASREFHLTKPSDKKKGFADQLPRIDLKMSSIKSQLEVKYYFEAKRLKEKDSRLKRSYIDEGMDRFISQKYPFGSMVGYLLEGEAGKTIKGINSLLKKDYRETEILIAKPHHTFKNQFESNHAQIGALKHFILDFNSPNSSN